MLVPALLFPILAQNRFPARRVDCLANIKLSASAQILYSTDFDDLLPPAATWVTASIPYADSTSVYQCPQVKSSSFGFARNAGVVKAQDPPGSIMLFESNNPRMNASGSPKTDMADPPRHGRANNLAYLDGSVAAVAPTLSGVRSPSSK